jgi:hypothetical protein
MSEKNQSPKKEKSWVDKIFEWLRGPVYTWLRNQAYDWFLKQLVAKSIGGFWGWLVKIIFEIGFKGIFIPNWYKFTRKVKTFLNNIMYSKKGRDLKNAIDEGDSEDIHDKFGNMP